MSFSEFRIDNCTFVENVAFDPPPETEAVALLSAVEADDGIAIVTNSIFWGNEPGQIWDLDGTLSLHYSNVEGGWDGAGSHNSNVNPLFAAPAEGNYRLGAGSPLIDAGDNTALPLEVTTDLDGNARFVDDPLSPDSGNGSSPVIDIGAYEMQAD